MTQDVRPRSRISYFPPHALLHRMFAKSFPIPKSRACYQRPYEQPKITSKKKLKYIKSDNYKFKPEKIEKTPQYMQSREFARRGERVIKRLPLRFRPFPSCARRTTRLSSLELPFKVATFPGREARRADNKYMCLCHQFAQRRSSCLFGENTVAVNDKERVEGWPKDRARLAAQPALACLVNWHIHGSFKFSFLLFADSDVDAFTLFKRNSI